MLCRNLRVKAIGRHYYRYNKNAPIKGHSHLIKTIYTNTKPQSTYYKGNLHKHKTH